MLGPLDSHEMDDFVRRLNAQLRKMPAEERSEVHQELRQHLDALVVAHEELGATPDEAVAAALRQFGDPKRIGRRLARDWRPGAQWPGQPDTFAFTYAYVWFAGTLAALAGAASVWGGVATVGNFWLSQGTAFLNTLTVGAGAVVPALAGWMTGRRTGRRAVPAIAGATMAVAAPLGLLGVLTSAFGHAPWEGVWGFAEMTACWLGLGTLTAYLSSVRAGGRWYRLHPSEMRLRLRSL